MDRIFLCSLFSFSVISRHFPFFSSFFSAACDKHQTLAKELVWHLRKIWPALSEPKKCRIPGFRHHISCGSWFFLDVAAKHARQISFLPSLFHQGLPLYSPNSLMVFPKNVYWNILESPWHLGYNLQTECQKWLFFVTFPNQPDHHDHFDWSKEFKKINAESALFSLSCFQRNPLCQYSRNSGQQKESIVEIWELLRKRLRRAFRLCPVLNVPIVRSQPANMIEFLIELKH